MAAVKAKSTTARFAIRKISNRNPRHARGFRRGHRRIWQMFVALCVTVATTGFVFVAADSFRADALKSDIFGDLTSSMADSLSSAGSGMVGSFTGADGCGNDGLIKSALGSLGSAITPIIGDKGATIKIGDTVLRLGGDCSLDQQFDGPGAEEGLQRFKAYYKGNTYSNLIGMISGWTNFVLPFVSVISIAAIVYAGFLYITAMGNEDQVGKAKNILLFVVIGIILIFSAYSIVNTVLSGNALT